jgi:large subunit ribosomal protein L10
MPSLVNRLVLGELTKEIGKAEGMLFISFGGLTVKESETLRGKLAAKGVRVRMVRNALARRVLADRGLEVADGVLAGNTAIAWGDSESAIHAAKLATEADVKKAGKVKIRAGVLDGKLLDGKDAAALAGVPDRKTLQAKLLACISGPARGLVATLNGLPGGLTRVVNARAATLPPEAAAEAPADAAPAAPESPPAGTDGAPDSAPAAS